MLTYKFKKSEELIHLARLEKQFNSKVTLTSSFPFQIMSAVSCRQNLPDLIEKMPDGQARDLVLKFINGKERLVILSYQACYPTSTKRTSQSYLQTLTVKSLLVLILIFFVSNQFFLIFQRQPNSNWRWHIHCRFIKECWTETRIGR